MSAHTPGPWVFVPMGNRPQVETQDGCNVVARIESLSYVADARLIAAAPELLEALKAIMGERRSPAGRSEHVSDMARAAIAKAEGRT